VLRIGSTDNVPRRSHLAAMMEVLAVAVNNPEERS